MKYKHIKLSAASIMFGLILGACTASGVDLTSVDSVENTKFKDGLLNSLIFNYRDFQPEIQIHKEEIRQCFQKVPIAQLLERSTTTVDQLKVKDINSQANLVISENILQVLTKCENFEKMNLGQYNLLSSQFNDSSCRKSIYWEKFHALRLSGVKISASAAEQFGKDVADCTNLVRRNINLNQQIYPWFDWDCLRSLDVVEVLGKVVARDLTNDLLGNEGTGLEEFTLGLTTEKLVDRFIWCIDFNKLKELLGNGNRQLPEFNAFKLCLQEQVKEQDLVKALNSKTEEERLVFFPVVLNRILPVCFRT